jgi:sugar phosphate isomerase/epimerase
MIALSTYSLFLRKNYLEAIQFAVDYGFQGVEIWSNVFDFAPGMVKDGEVEAIRTIAQKNHLSLAVHFIGDANLADINKGHLAESRRQLKETIRLCHDIGGEVVIIHPGIAAPLSLQKRHPLTQYPKFTLENIKREALLRFKESLQAATVIAEKFNVIIGLENFSHVKNCVQSTYADLVEWVDEVNSPALKITLDLGHANLEGGVEKAIEIFGSRIVHIHLNDNDGQSSLHGKLGSGTIDWRAIAPFLASFDGMLSLELIGLDDPEGEVLGSKTFLEDLLSQKAVGC